MECQTWRVDGHLSVTIILVQCRLGNCFEIHWCHEISLSTIYSLQCNNDINKALSGWLVEESTPYNVHRIIYLLSLYLSPSVLLSLSPSPPPPLSLSIFSSLYPHHIPFHSTHATVSLFDHLTSLPYHFTHCTRPYPWLHSVPPHGPPPSAAYWSHDVTGVPNDVTGVARRLSVAATACGTHRSRRASSIGRGLFWSRCRWWLWLCAPGERGTGRTAYTRKMSPSAPCPWSPPGRAAPGRTAAISPPSPAVWNRARWSGDRNVKTICWKWPTGRLSRAGRTAAADIWQTADSPCRHLTDDRQPLAASDVALIVINKSPRSDWRFVGRHIVSYIADMHGKRS